MGTITKPIMLDDTGKRIADAIELIVENNNSAYTIANNAKQTAENANEKVNQFEVKRETSLPNSLVDNTIYNLGVISGTLSIPTAPISTMGIRVNFRVRDDAFAISFADTPKWIEDVPELSLTNGSYTLCILDGIYSLHEIVE